VAVGGEEPWSFGALDSNRIVRTAHEHRGWLWHSEILTVIGYGGQRGEDRARWRIGAEAES